MYEVWLADKRVEKDLASIDEPMKTTIKATLLGLSKEPRPVGCRKLSGRLNGSYRIRIGRFRAIYDIEDKKKKIIILFVGHRREAYR